MTDKNDGAIPSAPRRGRPERHRQPARAAGRLPEGLFVRGAERPARGWQWNPQINLDLHTG